MKLNKPQISSILIILFHTVGLIGFLNPSLTPLFIKLVPFHLLLMMGLLIYSHSHKNKEFWLFFAVTFLAGFIIEVLGVSSGLIFGSYQYGETLGFKVADVPLLIGINWVILIYSIGTSVKFLKIKNHVIRAIIGAFLLLLLDILIEPVAVKFDYWSWEGMNIPFQNYVAWFIFSFIMLLFFYARKFKKQNIAALVLLISQAIFFAVLNL
ncbi:carotenoid biosynthesis protein [Daejeonella oryzae]|uniref:carotenoid biosynthesis protein n=1 Tax=Daejeonella oryzae TaxID=1122943 RepID=UPI000413F0BB|nr:carotenoid biosynthesis protein [Daejeonella oryzae]